MTPVPLRIKIGVNQEFELVITLAYTSKLRAPRFLWPESVPWFPIPPFVRVLRRNTIREPSSASSATKSFVGGQLKVLSSMYNAFSVPKYRGSLHEPSPYAFPPQPGILAMINSVRNEAVKVLWSMTPQKAPVVWMCLPNKLENELLSIRTA